MKYHIFTIFIALLVLSCSSGEQRGVNEDNIDELIDENIEIDSKLVEKGVQEKLDYIIENLHISDELIIKISENSDIYNEDLLNSVTKVSEYNLSFSKAVNMGIYGAELNYIIHFNQTQNSFRYLVVAKQMADEIGVAMAFDQRVMEEYQNNLQNKDTLINIVHIAYSDVRKYLRNGEQFLMSTLVMAGSWIENMYLALSQIDDMQMQDKKSSLVRSICSQDEYLLKIIELLTLLNEDLSDTYVKDFIKGLNDINDVFSKFATENNATADELEMLRQKLVDLRNNVTLNK